MRDLSELKPELLWQHFYQLTQIPRPSKNEKAVINYVHDFGLSLGLETIVDEVGNVIIRKPATPGNESKKGVVLQGHLDMVPQKNNDKQHDFLRDPIEAFVDGEWVTANGTTLGADDGIGVAAILAVLQSENINHGPVEALLTIDEETGMTGANYLRSGVLKGDILLNLDSEDEGELYVGCAGGSNGNMVFSFKETPVPVDAIAYKVILSGLKGGHSGMDINMGRGNANKIVFRFLKQAVSHYGARLSSIEGGNLRNAIPREAIAVVTVPSSKAEAFMNGVKDFEALMKVEIGSVDPGLSLRVEKVETPSFVMDEMTQDDLINAMQACPNGVVRMSADIPGLVETSLNMAIVKSDHKEVKVSALLRSSVDSAMRDLESTLESLFRLAGAEVWFDGQYPGWKPNMQSGILNTMKQVYMNKWGVEPQVKAIHAGLECGILGSAYPNWDMVSFGPTIRHPHSPDERVNINSVEKFWCFLVETLQSI
jgi:dipeptidase D